MEKTYKSMAASCHIILFVCWRNIVVVVGGFLALLLVVVDVLFRIFHLRERQQKIVFYPIIIALKYYI